MTRQSRLPVAIVALLAGASAVAGPTPAFAQAGDAALAEGLFRSARTLVAAGNYKEACPKFAESQRIDPKLGTLLNLALCHASEGKTASAWAEYTQAAELAARAGQAERERVARKSAHDLEGVLPHVTLTASGEASVVTWDGKAMSAAVFGTPLPVDPGNHELVVSAPGKASFHQTVVVPAGPGDQTVTIPPLQAEAALPIAPIVPAVAPPPSSEPTQDAPHDSHVLGYSLLGGAGAAIVVGSIFGGLALSEKSAAAGQCSSTQCFAPGLKDVSSLKTDEAVSTVAFGVGILAAGAGVYFVLRKPHHEAAARVAPLLGPGRAGLALSGDF